MNWLILLFGVSCALGGFLAGVVLCAIQDTRRERIRDERYRRYGRGR